jgi:streptomycin 6-kinase
MLDPHESVKRVSIDRYEPSADLKPFLDRIWIMKWDLRGRSAEEQQFLPSPNAHFVVGLGQAALVGVTRKVHSSAFEGAGQVLGLRFRAGGLRPFLEGPVARLTDRKVSASVLTGVADESVEAMISAGQDDEAMIHSAEALLRARSPKSDPHGGSRLRGCRLRAQGGRSASSRGVSRPDRRQPSILAKAVS